MTFRYVVLKDLQYRNGRWEDRLDNNSTCCDITCYDIYICVWHTRGIEPVVFVKGT